MIDTLAVDLVSGSKYEQRLINSAKELGWKVIHLTDGLSSLTKEQIENPYTWYHGDIETAKFCQANTNWQIHADWDKLDLLMFPRLSLDWTLFNKYTFLSIATFEEHTSRYFDELSQDGTLFVKSASADKMISGRLINRENFLEDWREMIFYGPPKNTVLAIASPKPIRNEARFLIVNGEIVTGSYYRCMGLKSYTPVLEYMGPWVAAKIYLKYLLSERYNPGLSWVMDLAETESGIWSIMEVGPTSCCDLYVCDTDKFCEALNKL